MKKNLFWLVLAAGIIIVYSACGPAGPPGAEGPPGTNGTSNIQFTTYTIAPIEAPAGVWTAQPGNPSPSGFSTNLTVPAITSDSNLVVQVYYSTKGTAGPWTAIPSQDVYFNSSSDTIDQIGFTWSPKTVTIVYNLMPPLQSILPKTTLYFVVSVIPPVYMKRHPNVNWHNVNAVMQLPEVEAELGIRGAN